MNEECGCCTGVEVLTPAPVANRPGLNALAYRVGTHARFLASMQARLSSRDYPALAALTTRAGSDPALAFLDAWATIADVLTFYQERIANEGYLRTATERRSILELARLVGYRLRPGVAASVFLAYTLDADRIVALEKGSRAQSVPGPGEQMQSFETSDPLDARAAWNLLRPRLTQPQDIQPTSNQIYFQGIATNLKPGDRLLLVFDGTAPPTQVRTVRTVEPDADGKRTLVTLLPATGFTARLAGATVHDIARRYRALAEFDISPQSRTAQTVLARLEGLTATSGGQNLTAIIQDLRSRLRTAQARGHTRVAHWLTAMIADMEPLAPANGDRDLPANGASRALAADRLDALVEALQVPHSIPPPNSLRLDRTKETTFGPRTDIAPQMLVTLKPVLQQHLYQAWANLESSTATTLESIQAWRVRAAPFGANAPLRPVHDSRGVVIGSTEWPLNGLLTASVDLLTTLFGSDSGPLLLSIARGLNRTAQREDLDESIVDLDVTLNGVRIQIRVTRDDGAITNLAFTFSATDFNVVFSILRRDDAMHLLLAGDPEADRLILPGDTTFSITAPGAPDQVLRQVTINYEPPSIDIGINLIEAAATQRGQLIITVDAPLPVADRAVLTLDAPYEQITPDTWVLIERPDPDHPAQTMSLLRKVNTARTTAIAAYGIAASRVTQLVLDADWLTLTDLWLTVLRGTTVAALSEVLVRPGDTAHTTLALADEPIDDDLCGDPDEQQGTDTIELDGLYDGLQSGRWLVVAGERTDHGLPLGVQEAELAMIAAVTHGHGPITDPPITPRPGDPVHTTITLAKRLNYCYRRSTLKIYGNVVRATHGETHTEVLGSGDAGRTFQTFALQQKPLTFVSAPTPAGIESTLTVRVNDLRWDETDSLSTLGPTDRGYITQADDDDKTKVIFGDGRTGARPATGVENIQATYRVGIGKPGNVRAGQISILASRPLGVRDVINPLPAGGGADREDRDAARRNVPIAALATDRLLGVQDYADFARTFAGIGKASARRLSDGRRQLVHLTIAGADDIPIPETSDLYRNLLQALHDYGDPHQIVRVATRELLLLVISARVRILPAYLWEAVAPKIRQALLDTFGFARRDLGQSVMTSQVISVIQGVEGVDYVDLDIFDTVDQARATEGWKGTETLAEELTVQEPGIPVYLARHGTTDPPGVIHPAQLAFLSPDIPDTLILRVL